MSIKSDALIEAGLTPNETKVYLAMLKLGSSSVNTIARKSGVHRVNAYDVIDRLTRKGLVSSIVKGNKRHYEAAAPDRLLAMLKKTEENIKGVLPELLLDFKMRKEKQDVFVFCGPEGVMTAYNMMLEERQTVYGIGGSGLNRKYLKHRHELWNKERLRRKIKIKALYYESTRKKKDSTWVGQISEIRYLPDKFKTLAMIDLCGDLVINLLPQEDNIMAIVIKNKVLADTYRTHFDFMWQFAEK